MTASAKSLLLPVVLILAGAGCGRSSDSAARGSDGVSAMHTPLPSVSDTTGLPDSLKPLKPLWEVYSGGSLGRSESCTRLYADGSMYTWSDTRRIEKNGLPSRQKAPFAWRLDARVSADGVAKVRALVQPDFAKLTTPAPGKLTQDQSLTVWRSCVDGTTHEAALTEKKSSALPAVLRDIDRAIQGAIVPGAVPLAQ